MKLSQKFLILIFTFLSVVSKYNSKHYYCTPSDDRHYALVKNLIGSIHHIDFEHLGEIAVFDLGLKPEQIAELNKMQKVKVCKVEMTHPDLLTPFVTADNGRKVAGYFAWKPVVIKQALDMYPYVLYADAGTTILKPLDDLFEYIQDKGYFLLSCTHNANCNLPNRITKNVVDAVIKKLPQKTQDILLSEHTIMIDAGMQGVSRAMMESYVLPMYNFAHNVDLFKDDGTAKFGYGAGRHDQTLFTVLAHVLGLKIHQEGFITLDYANKKVGAHIYWDRSGVNDNTIIYRSRHDNTFDGGRQQYIKFK